MVNSYPLALCPLISSAPGSSFLLTTLSFLSSPFPLHACFSADPSQGSQHQWCVYVCECFALSLALSAHLHEAAFRVGRKWGGPSSYVMYLGCPGPRFRKGCLQLQPGDSVQGRVTARRATPFTWLPLRAAEGQGKSPPKSQDGPEDFGFCIGREHCQGKRRQLSELEA